MVDVYIWLGLAWRTLQLQTHMSQTLNGFIKKLKQYQPNIFTLAKLIEQSLTGKNTKATIH